MEIVDQCIDFRGIFQIFPGRGAIDHDQLAGLGADGGFNAGFGILYDDAFLGRAASI